jgi:hypothetical protein
MEKAKGIKLNTQENPPDFAREVMERLKADGVKAEYAGQDEEAATTNIRVGSVALIKTHEKCDHSPALIYHLDTTLEIEQEHDNTPMGFLILNKQNKELAMIGVRFYAKVALPFLNPKIKDDLFISIEFHDFVNMLKEYLAEAAPECLIKEQVETVSKDDKKLVSQEVIEKQVAILEKLLTGENGEINLSDEQCLEALRAIAELKEIF